jgi:hypothetical protein
MPGSPRSISLNRVLPRATISRRIRGFQRSPRTWLAMVTGQYWPYSRTVDKVQKSY